MTALVIGKAKCIGCRNVAAQLKDKGYEVTVQDYDTDPDARALYAYLDGDGENFPLVILRGVPPEGLP